MPFMPSEAATAALRDIEHHVNLATEFVANLDCEAFQNDIRTVYAVTRCLEIISEASRRLPNEIKLRHPSIAWKEMAGQGIFIVTTTKMLAAKLVWDTVQLALPPLREVVVVEITRATKTGK
jgi:uncharacterized protein with HEPN domain